MAVFLAGNKKYVKVPPQSSAIVDAIKVSTIACREGGFEKAKPLMLAESGKSHKYKFAQQERYTSSYVEDVQRGIRSCKVR